MPFNLCKIGQLLRETREKRGITFDEASNALFIKKRVIEAIEAGDWDNLPHPVYVKGYLRQYAMFLNMLDLLKSVAASGEDESPVQGQGPEAFRNFHSQETSKNETRKSLLQEAVGLIVARKHRTYSAGRRVGD
jgi:cytoskeleton protein RodZ